MLMDHSPSYHNRRVFLFLQGPHGPFFSTLGRMLRASGAEVWRVGFNAGDQAFWFDSDRYVPFRGTPEEWPETLVDLIVGKGVTDLVLYGDTRPIHARAVEIAKSRGVTIHVFEEGYLRPWWVTYERNGSNGNSRLMDLSVEQMHSALQLSDTQTPPPSHWGDMRQHIFYGALYHGFVLFLNRKYRNFKPHRDLPVSKEFRLYFKRLSLMPFHRIMRGLATNRVRRTGNPFHLALLQLGHDSSVQNHSDYTSMSEFLEHAISGFAKGAPAHHHLVIKEHPLENHREPLRKRTRELARAHGDRPTGFTTCPAASWRNCWTRPTARSRSTRQPGSRCCGAGYPCAVSDARSMTSLNSFRGKRSKISSPIRTRRTKGPIASTGDSFWTRRRFPAAFIPAGVAVNCCAMRLI